MGFTRAHHLVKHKQECEAEEKEVEDMIIDKVDNLDEKTSAEPVDELEPSADDEPLANVKKELEEDDEDDIPLDSIPKLRLKKEQEEKVHTCKVRQIIFF